MSPSTERKQLTKTITFGLSSPYGWDSRNKQLVELSDHLRRDVYRSLRATSRVLAQVVNMLNAREYIRRIMKVPDELVDQFKSSYTPIRQELKELGIDAVGDIGPATLSQTYQLGVKPDFSGEHGKGLLMTGDRQIPLHKTNGTHPIYGRGKETILWKDGKRYYLVLQIFNLKWAKDKSLPSGWIAFPIKIKPRDKTGASQLEKVLNEQWMLKNSRLYRNPRKRGDRWLGQVVVAYTPEPFKELSRDIIMGIDLGVNVPACLHIRDNGKAKPWAMMVGRGRDMIHTRNTIKSEIIRIVRSLKSKDSPLDGAAREAAKGKLRDLRKRERRVMKTASQKLAARIAETALRNGAGVWQMEKLSDGLKDEPWLSRNWAPGMLVNAVRWKAEQLGAELVFVNPRYTSQRCSKCGLISPENRPKKKKQASYFKCTECQHEDHADKNAARNISIPDIDKIISEALEMAPNGAVQ